MTYTEQAIVMRPYIEKAVQSLPDTDALKVKTLYPFWEDLVLIGQVNTDGVPGLRFYYKGDGQLYRCTQGDPVFKTVWPPGLETAALYVRINESHAGTLEDPIPADRGMEYEYGMYYLDPEDGKIYLCKRDGEAEGGKVTLMYLPHELVDLYFVEVV